MASRNFFITGVTEILILKFLSLQDSYVYQMCKTIQEMSNNTLTISQNTIYSATYKLASEKYISEYSQLVGKRRTRIYYHIEEKGIEYLKKMETDYFQIANSIQTIYSKFPNNEVQHEWLYYCKKIF